MPFDWKANWVKLSFGHLKKKNEETTHSTSKNIERNWLYVFISQSEEVRGSWVFDFWVRVCGRVWVDKIKS